MFRQDILILENRLHCQNVTKSFPYNKTYYMYFAGFTPKYCDYLCYHSALPPFSSPMSSSCNNLMGAKTIFYLLGFLCRSVLSKTSARTQSYSSDRIISVSNRIVQLCHIHCIGDSDYRVHGRCRARSLTRKNT